MENGENQKNISGENLSEENGGEGDFGKVIDALHNKSKLSSLRTYQGDVAEFMKEKNESVISVALKERERSEKLGEERRPKSKPGNFKINLTILATSLTLVAGGVSVFFYIAGYLQNRDAAPTQIESSIFPYNNSVTLANVAAGNLGEELLKLPAQNGISSIKISNQSGEVISKSGDFLDFINVPKNISLRRTLRDSFMVGASSQNGKNYFLLVLSINDFGTAFSSMLEWEKTMDSDLAFLTTAKSYVQNTGTFSWKDMIVKNKDVRGLVNEKGEIKIAYTFLDKNTILITDNAFSIGDMASIFASRAVVR